MSWTISLAAAPRYLYVFLSGRFELQEFNEMLDDVFTVKENFPGHSILFSDLELDVKRLKPDEMASVSSKFVEKNNVIAETKVAIVMKTAEEFELADRWRSATEPMSEARFNIFRNERKAMKWLEQAV